MRNVKLRSGALKSGGTTLSLIIVYILMCTVFSILSPYFLKVKNFTNILVYMSITGVMAAGVTVTMLLGAMDISQYAIATMASVVAARIIKSGGSIAFAIPMENAIRYASCVASLSVTKPGVTESVPTVEQVEALCRNTMEARNAE